MALNLPQDEIPTADAVAVALVAAAKVLGEDPLKVGEPSAWLRSRYPALRALQIYYGAMPVTALGRYVGIVAGVHTRLKSSGDATWWPTLGEQAIAAASDALEAL